MDAAQLNSSRSRLQGRGVLPVGDAGMRVRLPGRGRAGWMVRRRVASVCAVLLAVPLLALVSAAGPAAAQTPATACAATTATTDYDTDDDRLIEICSLAQLDAVRWDLNGDGTADVYRDGAHDAAGAAGYAAAFPSAAAGMGCPSAGCEGYELAVDLDFDTNGSGTADAGDSYWNGGKGWTPIGGPNLTDSQDFSRRSRLGLDCVVSLHHSCRDHEFRAVFDGNGHTVANLHIADNRVKVGLFGTVSGGTIRNVGLTAPDFGSVSGYRYVGSLVGELRSGGRVSGSWSEIDVSGENSKIGGLVGIVWQDAAVEGSWAGGDVTVTTAWGGTAGGLVGGLNGSHIAASYATGDVTCGDGVCGGLLGDRSSGGLVATYATGDVTVTHGYRGPSGPGWAFHGQFSAIAGGLVGYVSHGSDPRGFRANYSTGQVTVPDGALGSGGLIGLCEPWSRSGDMPHASHWDKQASGVASPTTCESAHLDGDGQLRRVTQQLTGYSTSELQSPTGYSGIFADWDVDVDGDGSADDPWDFGTSTQYPVLKWGSLDPAAQRAAMGSTDTPGGGETTVVDEQQQDSQQGQQQDVPADQEQQPGYAVDAAVVAKVRALAGQVQHGSAHVNRWSRVLVAFGVLDGAGVSGGPMTVAQAQQMADEHSSPVWDEVVTELTNLEASNTEGEDDDDPPPTPVVSVAAGSAVSEGGTASFTVTASPVPATPITVKVGVSESGSFGAAGAATVQVSSATTTYTVTTTDDQADEADGSVTVTLQDGSGYTVSSSAGAATVSVADDDVPEVSVAAGSAISEGGTASFTITASPAPATAVTVKVAVSESGSFGAAGAATVTLSGASTAYTVTTVDDQADEADASVTVTLQGGSGYTVSSTAGAATVAVADDDDPPPLDPPADQGQQDSQRQQDPPPGYTVDSAVVAKVEALAGQVHHGEVHVNRWSRVLVAFGVHDGTGVTGGPMTAAQAQEMADRHSSPVWDEVVAELTALEASQNDQQDQQQGSQQDQQADQTPEVSISSGSGVTEGGAASFTITASPVPSSPVTVSVGVSESGSFGAVGAATVTVSGATTTYTVTTVDDDVDEADGSVTVTLQDGSGYTVSSSSGAATVTVADDDDPPIPVVSISAGSGVTEGGTATFTVSASPVPSSPVTVKVAVAESGDFGASGAATVTVSGASTTYTVTTVDDQADEADGSVTVTLQGGSGYTVSSASNTATVSVADDDDPPALEPPAEDGPIEMSVSDASAVEGEDLVFTITLSRAADAPVDVVYVTLEGTASSADYAFGNDIVTIAAGQTALTVSIATTADSLAEGAERMYFELAAVFGDADVNIADGYALAVGTITDN